MMSMTSRVRASGLENGAPYQPSTTCGPLTPMPSTTRPPVRWSRVSACIAIDVGLRPDICTIEVPRRTRLVSRPHHASGVNASDPHASAVKIGVEAGVLGGGDELADTLRRLCAPVAELQS